MADFVEAIENGKIVKVSEEYATRERLLVIRKRQHSLPFSANPKAAQAIKPDSARRFKPSYLKNDILSELKENFQWELQKQRRLRNLSRHQLSTLSGVQENEIALLEKGEIPNDFIALAKLEAFYGISVRK